MQIRDGDQGYSTLIGHYCGSDFPPMITSSGRSLWLRFVSDGTIEYSGFRAVYEYVLNPMEIIPFIPKCEFEIGGAMDFIGELWSMNVLYISTCFSKLHNSINWKICFSRSIGAYCMKEHLGNGKLWGLCTAAWKGKEFLSRKVEHRIRGEKWMGGKFLRLTSWLYT